MENREISFCGRIIQCKTFLLSQINYVIQSLALPEQVLNEIDSLLKLIWQKRGCNKIVFEKIKREVNYIPKSSLLHPDQNFDKAVKNWFWKNAACSYSSLYHNLKGE